MKYRFACISVFILGVSVVLFGLPLVTEATSTPTRGIDLGTGLIHGAGSTAGFSTANENSFAMMLGNAVRIMLSFLGIAFTILAVYAGIMWMTARGNDSQVESSKKTLQNAVIGLLIALLAYSITGFVMRAFETAGPSAPPNESGDGGLGESCREDSDCIGDLQCKRRNALAPLKCWDF